MFANFIDCSEEPYVRDNVSIKDIREISVEALWATTFSHNFALRI